mgnify:CR=1 FL=1
MATAPVSPAPAPAQVSQGEVLPPPACAELRSYVWRAVRLYPELRSRIIAAGELAALYEIRRLDPATHIYSVPSQSNALGSYTVRLGREGTCTCPDYPRAPRGYCKHRLAVALVLRIQADAAARAAQAPDYIDDHLSC